MHPKDERERVSHAGRRAGLGNADEIGRRCSSYRGWRLAVVGQPRQSRNTFRRGREIDGPELGRSNNGERAGTGVAGGVRAISAWWRAQVSAFRPLIRQLQRPEVPVEFPNSVCYSLSHIHTTWPSRCATPLPLQRRSYGETIKTSQHSRPLQGRDSLILLGADSLFPRQSTRLPACLISLHCGAPSIAIAMPQENAAAAQPPAR